MKTHVFMEPDPVLGSQKCPYESGSGSKEALKKKNHTKKFLTKYFKMTLKNHKKFINKI